MVDLNTLESLGGIESDQKLGQTPDSRVQRQGAPSTTEERALSLLGSGISAEQAALALGVSASRISQLLADSTFSNKVEALRYEGLQEHNERDSSYDKLEDQLVLKLEAAMPMMIRPSDILRAITVINGAKRRGQSAPEQVAASATVVSLILPAQITQKFTTNTLNQVIAAGEQNLVTIQSATLLANAEKAASAREIQDDTKDRYKHREESAKPRQSEPA